MMKTIYRTISVLLLMFIALSAHAQRTMEKLDRSVVAMKIAGGVYVNWRITADEWYNVSYNIYRDNVKLNDTPITGASNYTDASGTVNHKYTVTSVYNGVESAPSAAATPRTTDYIAVKVKDRVSGYIINDCTAADLDGDGEYEIIVKRCYNDWSVDCTLYSYFEAYKLDGTLLWEINVGPNILPDVEINIAAFDFDSDGKAEVFMRTSEGTIFGDGTQIGDVGNAAGAFIPDGVTNYRYGVNQSANMSYMIYGPEMLSLIDGETGTELDRVPFIARGAASDWGDGYGHRCSKYFFGAPYLDGVHPSLFIGRGIYTQTKMKTYDVVNKKLVERWSWESGTSGSYFGQGNHNYTIADVDGDGRDEITWGSMCVDEYGKGLYSTGLGHGDAMHVGDFDPYHKGQEVFSCLENSPQFGILLRDATTGKILLHKTTTGDCGRCCAGNISEAYPGAELWGGGYGYGASDLNTEVGHFGTAENFTIYWDGDILKEICDHRSFSTGTGYGYGTITKFISHGNIQTLLAASAISCNYTKGTPCLQADILGDWREEVIWHTTDEKYFYIYTTPYPTTYRFYTLMHDPQYRQAICWQMCGYNQPPHPSFFLGVSEGMILPPPPAATNGKLVWTGQNTEWNKTATTAFLYDSVATAFSDGKQVLFDVSAADYSLSLSENLAPEVLTVNSPDDYTIDGTSGSITGTGRMNKMGEGTLFLSGDHTFTGPAEIWAGTLTLDGSLASDVDMKHFSVLNANSTLGGNVRMAYAAQLYIGAKDQIDTLIIKDTLTMTKGAVLEIDLSQYPSDTVASAGLNDYLKVGCLMLEKGAIIQLNQTHDSLGVGRYELLEASDSMTFDLNEITLKGLGGFVGELSIEDHKLILTTRGVREPSSVLWSGAESALWDRSASSNWVNQKEDADIFVIGDTVTFNDDAVSSAVVLVDEISPSLITVNSDSVNFTVSGDGYLSGSTSLTKRGSSTLTINNRNSYTGKTIVEGGKLISKYAPTSVNNGGIGTNNTQTAYLAVSNGATLQFNTAGEETNRGLYIGTGGMILNTPYNLKWSGRIQGSSLTKTGSGQLRLSGANTGLSLITLNGGELYLDETNNVFSSAGSKIVIQNGTLTFHNDVGSYSSASVALNVPENSAGTIYLDGRCSYTGALTGAGTINLVTDYVRADLAGNWSAFSGRINVTGNSANSKYNDDLRIANTYGYANAWLNLGAAVYMYHTTGGTSVKIGHLTGTGTSYISSTSLEVGAKGWNGTFAGVISGSVAVNKVGSGTWTLSGANTYTGITKVTGGTLAVSGSLATSSMVVNAGTALNLTGSIAGSATINGMLYGADGTITKAVTVGSTAVISPSDTLRTGTINFGNNLTLNGCTLDMQIRSGVTTYADKLAVSGLLTCGGTLRVKSLSISALLKTGRKFQLFSFGSISGAFDEIILPELDDIYEWDLSTLYTDGYIRIIASTGINKPLVKAGFMENPSDGIFWVYLEEACSEVNVKVCNLQGQVVYEGVSDVSGAAFSVDLTGQAPGIYTMQMSSKEKVYSALKLKKE